MKFIANQRAWKRWAAPINTGQPQSLIDPPVAYPCFAYLQVQSFGYEEEMALYLYADDIARMARAIDGK